MAKCNLGVQMIIHN